jgi:hypothetical protein
MVEFDGTKTTGSQLTAAEYNAIVDHAFEKPYSFLVRINGIYYEAIHGGGANQAGKIAYGGSGNVGGVDGTDASAVIQAAINAGGRTFIKDATYDLTASLNPPDFAEVHGESLHTILRPANDTVTPLIDINLQEGTNNRQEKITIDNLQIEMRDFAASEAIHIHNLKGSWFTRLYIKGTKGNVFTFDSTSIGNSFWNHIRDIKLDSNAPVNTDPTTCSAIIHCRKNVLDSWIDGITGTANNYIGFRAYGASMIQIKNYWTTGNLHVAFLKPNQEGGGYGVNHLTFRDCVSDYSKRHPFYLDRNLGTLTDITFEDTTFMQPLDAANTYSLFYIDVANATTVDRCKVINSKTGNAPGHKYFIERVGLGATLNCQWRNNIVLHGATGDTVGLVAGDQIENVYY